VGEDEWELRKKERKKKKKTITGEIEGDLHGRGRVPVGSNYANGATS